MIETAQLMLNCSGYFIKNVTVRRLQILCCLHSESKRTSSCEYQIGILVSVLVQIPDGIARDDEAGTYVMPCLPQSDRD